MPGRHDFTTSHPVSWGVLAERIFEAVYPGMAPRPWDFGPGEIDRGRIGIANDHWLRYHQRPDGMSWTYSRRCGTDADAAAVVAAVLATPIPTYQLTDEEVQSSLDVCLAKPAIMSISSGDTWEVTLAGHVERSQLNTILHPRGYVWWYGRVTSSVGVHGPTIVIQRKTQ